MAQTERSPNLQYLLSREEGLQWRTNRKGNIPRDQKEKYKLNTREGNGLEIVYDCEC